MPQATARIQQAAQRQQSLVLDLSVYIRVKVFAQGENQENNLFGTGTKVTARSQSIKNQISSVLVPFSLGRKQIRVASGEQPLAL